MIYAVVYILFAAELGWVMSANPMLLWPLLYPMISFFVAGIGFLFSQPEFFGKKPDGRFRTPFLLLHLPYHAVSMIAEGVRKMRMNKHRAYDEIVPGLWLGARTRNLPEGVERIVDLTAEHSRIDIPVDDYMLVATLDGQAPDLDAMVAAIEQIESSPKNTYVHCWAGRGRSATLVAGVLIARGLATSADEAERYMQAKRPIVGLSESQREVVNQYAMRLRGAAATPQ